MVRAIFTEIEGGYEMRILGHADFAEAGKDPVCAGASILAFTAAQYVMLLDDYLEEDPIIHVSGGNVRVVAKPKPEADAAVRQVFAMAQVGFLLLQEAYPESVKLLDPEQSVQDNTTDSPT